MVVSALAREGRIISSPLERATAGTATVGAVGTDRSRETRGGNLREELPASRHRQVMDTDLVSCLVHPTGRTTTQGVSCQVIARTVATVIAAR